MLQKTIFFIYKNPFFSISKKIEISFYLLTRQHQHLRVTHLILTIMASNNVIALPSVCLPRVYHKFDANYVEGIFCELFGPDMYGNSCVAKVDMISRTDRNTGEPFHVVFIHFSEYMYESDYLNDFAERINKDEEVKIQYNPPWFWKVRKNKAATRKEVRTGPRIMSRKDEEEFMKAQREILQERNNTSGKSEENDDGDYGCFTNAQKRREQRKRASERKMDEDALNRLKEEADKVNESPPPLEWGEDADAAEAR